MTAPGSPGSGSCPNCGAALVATRMDRNARTPPWICEPCARAWWPLELTPPARASWNPATRSHGTGAAADALRRAVEREADLSHKVN